MSITYWLVISVLLISELLGRTELKTEARVNA